MPTQSAASHLPQGYTVGYSPDMAQARVYGVGGAGIVLLVTAFFQSSVVLFVLGCAAVLFAAHFLPMADPKQPRIGASQYGAFAEGLGLIAWRDIEAIEHVTIAVRTITTHELQLKLKRPITSALLADWRSLPWYRLLMHLPWRMSDGNVIRMPLDTLSRPPEEIERRFKRMQEFYRTSGGRSRAVKPGHVPDAGGTTVAASSEDNLG